MQFITRNPDVDKFVLLGMLNYEQLSILNCANKYLRRNIHKIGMRFETYDNKYISRSMLKVGTRFKVFDYRERLLRNIPTRMLHHDYDIFAHSFICACVSGDLSKAKTVMNILCCDHATNRLKMGLFAQNGYIFNMLIAVLKDVCVYGYLDIAIYLHKIQNNIFETAGGRDDHGDPHIVVAFLSAIINNHMKVAQWLLEVTPQKQMILVSYITSCFESICNSCELNMIKWLFSLTKINQFNGPFKGACRNGKLQIAEWLWDISNETIDIHDEAEEAFHSACRNGHLHVAQWLWKISNHTINIYIADHAAFKCACDRQNFQVAAWLCTLTDKYSIKMNLTPIIKN